LLTFEFIGIALHLTAKVLDPLRELVQLMIKVESGSTIDG
jgi:hypothetical protein